MTTQHTPSFDQELARQVKATESAQALADDYRRQLDKLRAALAAQGAHIPALHAHAERLESERDELKRLCAHLMAERDISDMMHDAQIQERDQAVRNLEISRRARRVVEAQLEEASRQLSERDAALASLATLRAAARAVCASRVRCTDDVAMVDRAALGELERMVVGKDGTA